MASPRPDVLSAAVAGDHAALSELLAHYGPETRRNLRISAVWQRVLDAADVMQVTYLEAFLRIHQLETSTLNGFRAWLEQLAQHNLRDAIRELERHKRPDPRNQVGPGPGDESSTRLLETLGSAAPTASHVAAGGEWREALGLALAQLPPLYADVVRLHDLEGRPVAEIASRLGRSAGAVHMLRARALDRLREVLGPESRFLSGGA